MRQGVLSFIALLALTGTLSFEPGAANGASSEIGAQEFARLVADLSEPEGYFDTDNFISNEAGYLKVLPALRRLNVSGGVYLGVGPDQNYSYIAEVHPCLAFIVDIRRQNLLQHLYFKALFELSPDREAFVRRLFGRRSVGGMTEPRRGLKQILDRLETDRPDTEETDRCLSEARAVIRRWHLPLSTADYDAIDYVGHSFAEAGSELRFSSYNRAPSLRYPTYRTLLLETDSAGRPANYLASDERYNTIRELQAQNRIVPVVGDLGGYGAVPRIGREVIARKLRVTCFYVSNVEFYLFGNERWSAYLRNIRALPWAPNAVFIRSVSNNWNSHPAWTPGYYMTTLVQQVSKFLTHEAAGRNATYWDLVTNDYIAR